jgi:hypothetical protein
MILNSSIDSRRRRREQRDVRADVDVRHAVDQPVDRVAAGAVDRQAHRAGEADADFVGEIELLTPGHERRQLHEVAVVERQLLHLDGRHESSAAAGSRLDELCAGGDLDHVRELSDAADRASFASMPFAV